MEDYAEQLTAERIRRVINGYEFKGIQRTDLLRETLTWRALKRAADLIHKIEGIQNLHGHEFDRIKKTVKDGEVIVSGEKTIAKRAEGLGGNFTFCSLGEAIELDRLLTGETLPAAQTLGALLFHMATNEVQTNSSAVSAKVAGCRYLGESAIFHVWLLYRPDLDFLKSREAALTLARAEALASAMPKGKRHLVFAAAKFVSQKLLNEKRVPVEFAPLPFALYRAERG
jgi:adenine-specific DNA-methyltransferase